LPHEVIDHVNQISRDFLRGGLQSSKGPHLFHETHKKYGELGLKNLAAWNKARIAKLVRCIAKKKDMLWVKWVHGKYLKHKLVGLPSPLLLQLVLEKNSDK